MDDSPRALVSRAKEAMDSHDALALSALFAPDGRVHDEGRVHTGRPAIARWFEQTPSITLETISQEGDGSRQELVAKAHGDYPQSPLTFRYDFGLADDGIRSLEISLVDQPD